MLGTEVLVFLRCLAAKVLRQVLLYLIIYCRTTMRNLMEMTSVDPWPVQ